MVCVEDDRVTFRYLDSGKKKRVGSSFGDSCSCLRRRGMNGGDMGRILEAFLVACCSRWWDEKQSLAEFEPCSI